MSMRNTLPPLSETIMRILATPEAQAQGAVAPWVLEVMTGQGARSVRMTLNTLIARGLVARTEDGVSITIDGYRLLAR